MDFMNRNARPTHSGAQPADSPVPGTTGSSSKKGKFKRDSRLSQILSVVFSVAVLVLIIAVLSSVIFSKSQREGQYVDESKLQAVFLNGGQVYFGNISTLNDNYLKLNNVYYLRVNNQDAQNTQASANANDVSLVKLGCELHGPQDQMLITKDQVIFWENLKTDGQVAKAVAEYVKANPQGQKCEENTGNTGGNLQSGGTNTNTQGTTGTPGTGTTGTGTTPPSTTNPKRP